MTFKNLLFGKLKVYLLPEFLRYQLFLYKYRIDDILSCLLKEFANWIHIAGNIEKTLILAWKSWVFRTYLVFQFSKIFILSSIFAKTKQLSVAVCSNNFDGLAKFFSSKVGITSDNLVLVRKIFFFIFYSEMNLNSLSRSEFNVVSKNMIFIFMRWKLSFKTLNLTSNINC